MATNEKKPDLVVWNEEEGYYQKGLTYGTDLNAPAISMENITGWKQANAGLANKNFKTKFAELKAAYDQLVEEVNVNEMVYASKYSFTPIMGEVYHLYRKADGTLFLSLIEPNSWKQEFVGSFRLDTNHKWCRI
jgi:hypothetical protein